MIGKLFNERYQIKEKLGSGGTAIVYMGQDILLNRMVTVKILREEYASNEEFVRRFRREAQAVASLSHGNIVSVYDVGFEENMHYIVMEFVEGQSLKGYIKEKGALAVQEAASVMMQILDGISYAHEHGIVHRDIKPHNILLGRDGRAKVTDFGIAVGMSDMTQTYNTSSRIMGSVHYIAPEQVQGQQVTKKSDIYSAGVVFYEMLTGQLPFSGDTPISIAMQHVQGELILPHQLNPKVPMGLSYVVMRAMRKNPETRYDSAREMMEAIHSVAEGLNSVYVPPPEDDLENTRELKAPLTFKDRYPVRERAGGIAGGLFRREKSKTAPRRPRPSKARSEETQPADYRQERDRNAPRRRINVMSIILLLLLIAFAGTVVWAVDKIVGWVGEEQVAPTTVTVPDLLGWDLADAEEKLLSLELVPVHTTKYDEVIGVNKVMQQNPPASSEVKSGREITLTVSAGPRLTEVPLVVGDSVVMAETKLFNRGLLYDYLEPEYNEDFLAGQIFSQDPKANVQVPGGTTVFLTVSLGPEPFPVEVPSMLEHSLDDAKAMLEEAGLTLAPVKYEESYTYYPEIVMAQSAPGGSELNEGDTVILTVSRGPGPSSRGTTVGFDVPNDGQSHLITIVIDDAQGPARKVYDQTLSPGYQLREPITYFSPATVSIYCDDILEDQYQL
ncbi:MAG: Stk1 family PASTA domain-containing Ser/Thr kinase [Clostridiales bacterium]|nr:Stk1 family PASTA domain-containing Ser/Thr kinase [Clostridiales bacterium]